MMNSIIDTITGSNVIFFSILGVLLLIIIVMILLIRKENKKKVEDREDERIMREVNDALKVVEEKEITDTVAIPTVESEEEKKEEEPHVPSEEVEATDENAPLSLSDVVAFNEAEVVEQPSLPTTELEDIKPSEVSLPDIINEHVESPSLTNLNPAVPEMEVNTEEDKELEEQIDAFATRSVNINDEAEDPEINEAAIEPVPEKVVPTIEEAFEKMHQTKAPEEEVTIKPAIPIEEEVVPETEDTEEKLGPTLQETMEKMREEKKQEIVEIVPEEEKLGPTLLETMEMMREQHITETEEEKAEEDEVSVMPEEDPVIPEIIAPTIEEEITPEVEEPVVEEKEEVVLAPTIDIPEVTEEDESSEDEGTAPIIPVDFQEEPKAQKSAPFLSSIKPVGAYEEVPEYKSEVQYTTTIPIVNMELPTNEEKDEVVEEPVVEIPEVQEQPTEESPVIEEEKEEIPVFESTPVIEEEDEEIPVYRPEEEQEDIPVYKPEEEQEDIPVYKPEEEQKDIPVYRPAEEEKIGPSLKETMELMRMRKVEPEIEETIPEQPIIKEEKDSEDKIKVVEEEEYNIFQKEQPEEDIPVYRPAEEEQEDIPVYRPEEEQPVKEEPVKEEPVIEEPEEDETDDSEETSSGSPFRYLEDTQPIRIPEEKEEPVEEVSSPLEEPNTDEEEYYNYEEDTEDEPVEGVTLSELSGEQITDDNLNELKEKLSQFEQEQPKVAHMTPYEVEQEEKAIISYDELKKQNDNVSIEYQEQEEVNPEVDIKQVDLEKTGRIELDPIKKAINSKVDNSQYGHEEEFLDTLKQLNDLLK